MVRRGHRQTLSVVLPCLVPPHARGVGFVFQDLALWPHLTVAGNLDFVLGAAGVVKRERRGRIDEVLRLVRIEAFARQYPGRLSGGEQLRAAIARSRRPPAVAPARRADVEP